jgi:hypothetical protein
MKFGRKPNLTDHQKREAIKRRDKDEETLRSIGRSYNVYLAVYLNDPLNLECRVLVLTR